MGWGVSCKVYGRNRSQHNKVARVSVSSSGVCWNQRASINCWYKFRLSSHLIQFLCKTTSSRHGPQSRISAERIDRQEQGPYATISPISSASVLPRRSSRLARYKQKPSALQSELTVNANTTAQSLSIKIAPRRSKRISQQKEKISGSMLNSIMAPHTNSFKSITRPKPKLRVARNGLGIELTKPSGVSKRQFKKCSQIGAKKVRLWCEHHGSRGGCRDSR